MNHRVVITGMGALTPIGNDIPTFWANIKKGSCGIDFI
ncbi:MAG TPA: beta-ketoacyl synthase N-terminal-like domain-containing protein, partial [Atribacterota bacterium]|nr:beta-ketoacyl synthase N-terminal-like domain-containing protein [Atribacterota bacterium]